MRFVSCLWWAEAGSCSKRRSKVGAVDKTATSRSLFTSTKIPLPVAWLTGVDSVRQVATRISCLSGLLSVEEALVNSQISAKVNTLFIADSACE